MAAESRGAVLAALAGNAALAALKATAAGFTGSSAMLAETFHSLADTGNQVLLFLGLSRARRPPDARHPFGHGREVYFWAFVVSVLLFGVGGGFAIWEAVRTFLHPTPHESFGWAYGVLAGAFLFESTSLAVALRAFRRGRRGRPLRDYLRDLRDPTLLTVVSEDSAALVSIAIAAAGIAATQATGAVVWDGIASALIGALLIAVAVFLAVESYSLLIGEAPPAEVECCIRRVVGGDDAVARVTALHTMHLGPEALLIAVDVEFARGLSTAEIEAAVLRLHDEIRRALPAARPHVVLVEPMRDGGAPAQPMASGRAGADRPPSRNGDASRAPVV